jgi:hypothetical protein
MTFHAEGKRREGCVIMWVPYAGLLFCVIVYFAEKRKKEFDGTSLIALLSLVVFNAGLIITNPFGGVDIDIVGILVVYFMMLMFVVPFIGVLIGSLFYLKEKMS